MDYYGYTQGAMLSDFTYNMYLVLDWCGEFGIYTNVMDINQLYYYREEVFTLNDFLQKAAQLKGYEYMDKDVENTQKITGASWEEYDKLNGTVGTDSISVFNDEKKEKENALRYNNGKTRYGLIPDYALNEMAKVMTYGAKKYSADNWRKGLSFTSCLDSLERHIAKFKIGQDYDEETGLHHLAHAMANCSFIMEYSLTHPELDNRQHKYLHIPKIGLDIDDVIADFCGAYCEKFGVSTPKWWNFDYNIKERLSGDFLNDFYLGLKPKINPDDMKFEPTCYITSRPVSTEITKKWLEMNGFPCVPVYTVDMNHPKVKVAKESEIDLFIDDRFDNFVELNNNGVCTFLMDMPHNQRYDVGYKRIKDINEVVNRFNNI